MALRVPLARRVTRVSRVNRALMEPLVKRVTRVIRVTLVLKARKVLRVKTQVLPNCPTTSWRQFTTSSYSKVMKKRNTLVASMRLISTTRMKLTVAVA